MAGYPPDEGDSDGDEQGSESASPRLHSRACPGRGCSVDERVAWCRYLMANGLWFGNATRHELAEAWGIAPETVKHASAEASRWLRMDPAQLEEERIAHAAYAARIQQDALRRVSIITGLPDYQAALKANEQAAKFKGIKLEPEDAKEQKPVTRVEIVLTDGDDAKADPKPE